MNFLAGMYLGGIIVHVVVFRGTNLPVMAGALLWPVLVARALVSDLLEMVQR